MDKVVKLIYKVDELRDYIAKYQRQNASIGFVPTMGFLHEGHLSMVRQSMQDNLITIVSVFVDPKSFNSGADYKNYPRDIPRDETFLKEELVDCLFIPDVNEIYKERFGTEVFALRDVCNIDKNYQAVCNNLDSFYQLFMLCLLKPTNIYLNKRAYHKYMAYSRIVGDMGFNCIVQGFSPAREWDGLAMGANNVLVPEDRRISALSLSNSFDIVDAMRKSRHRYNKVVSNVKEFISSHEDTVVEYVELIDPRSLCTISDLSAPFIYLISANVCGSSLQDYKHFERL